jgi:hypothetical protein
MKPFREFLVEAPAPGELVFHKDVGIPPQLAAGPPSGLKLLYSAHARQEALKDGLKAAPSRMPAIFTLIEVAINKQNAIVKWVVRLPMVDLPNDDLVLVVQPDGLVRTLWLNNKFDTHRTLRTNLYAKPAAYRLREGVEPLLSLRHVDLLVTWVNAGDSVPHALRDEMARMLEEFCGVNGAYRALRPSYGTMVYRGQDSPQVHLGAQSFSYGYDIAAGFGRRVFETRVSEHLHTIDLMKAARLASPTARFPTAVSSLDIDAEEKECIVLVTPEVQHLIELSDGPLEDPYRRDPWVDSDDA